MLKSQKFAIKFEKIQKSTDGVIEAEITEYLFMLGNCGYEIGKYKMTINVF